MSLHVCPRECWKGNHFLAESIILLPAVPEHHTSTGRILPLWNKPVSDHYIPTIGEIFSTIDRRDGEMLICRSGVPSGAEEAIILPPAYVLALSQFLN